MIRKIQVHEIDKLRPLLESFYLEQNTYLESFDWNYILQNLNIICGSGSYLVLVDDEFTCFFIGHITTNLLLPVREAYEDYIYVHPKSRGTKKFIKMITAFKEWGQLHNCNYINLGVGTGIIDEVVKNMYTRMGFKEYYAGFKKEIKKCAVEDAEALLVG